MAVSIIRIERPFDYLPDYLSFLKPVRRCIIGILPVFIGSLKPFSNGYSLQSIQFVVKFHISLDLNLGIRVYIWPIHIFLIRNWSIRKWDYKGQTFKKLAGYISPTLRNWSIVKSRN